jgi:hypothetical protein
MQMAEEEGFEPPRALTPVGFQDRSLQPGLGIPPSQYSSIYINKDGGPGRTRTYDRPVMSRWL